MTYLNVLTEFSSGFVKGFIYTTLICLSLTGLYFLGYYVGKIIF